MSGSLDTIDITDERVKIITQYHQFKDLMFEIADTAGIDMSKMDNIHRHFVVNVILRNFLGDESYNKYVENFKTYPNQLN